MKTRQYVHKPAQDMSRGERVIIDPTQIQFLGGKPQIAEESDWKLRLKSVKIVFDGANYEPAQAIKVKDCENAAEAI